MNISKATRDIAIKALEQMRKDYAWGKKMFMDGLRSAYDINCAQNYDRLTSAIEELKGKKKNGKKA